MSEENKAPAQEPVPAGQATDTTAEPTAGDLLQLLEDARSKADDHWNQVLRTRAELENARRRAQRDVESAHKFGLEKIAQELLPVKDSLELGLGAASDNGGGGDDRVAKLREGMELTLKMLGGVLEKFGIVEVNPQGQPFDPQWHQAMSMVEVAGQAPNTVVTVMQKGYVLNERLLRPAMVVVARAPAGIDEQA